LVQFGEAMDHGIGTERLGDGIEGSIAEYWELLFDLETGYWREEIQDEYEASGCDLLIIDCMEIRPRWRGFNRYHEPVRQLLGTRIMPAPQLHSP